LGLKNFTTSANHNKKKKYSLWLIATTGFVTIYIQECVIVQTTMTLGVLRKCRQRPFQIKKVLTKGDIGRMNRLLLGKKLVEDLVLSVLGGNVGIGIQAKIPYS